MISGHSVVSAAGKRQRHSGNKVGPLVRLIVPIRKKVGAGIGGAGEARASAVGVELIGGLSGVLQMELLRSMFTVSGWPVCHMPRLLSDHPPTILPKASRVIQVRGPRPEGKLIVHVCDEIMADVEDARTVVASEAIDVFRPAGFAAADRPIVNRMGICVAGQKRKPAAELPLKRKVQPIVGARSDVALIIDGAIGIRIERVRKILIQRTNAIRRSPG